ncbi:MAG: yedF [Bacillota bacterium]|jgi:selenium metabolism protein YedF|nr:yedF [Bacillota bacterium]
MKIVDARGKTCPQPVILTKNEVDAGELEITIIVDNETSKQNVLKFGTKLNYKCEVENKEDGTYIQMTKLNNNESTTCVESEKIIKNIDKNQSKGYVIGTNILGNGSEQLGKSLMKAFIYTITETKPYPSFLIFLNSGVKLTTEGSDSIDDLQKLLECGVKIVSCGTCLDFFEIKTKLQVGQITNMYDIVETITNSDNTVMI